MKTSPTLIPPSFAFLLLTHRQLLTFVYVFCILQQLQLLEYDLYLTYTSHLTARDTELTS